ncbi:hypothetical protein AB0N62_42945 [Streptomyces sp. NPDC093982]|uniref:hypothetical protein n=1 Tax=Streptomyces sp. NPDC093982 TaxID=3155077 RepID=UPI003420F120
MRAAVLGLTVAAGAAVGGQAVAAPGAGSGGQHQARTGAPEVVNPHQASERFGIPDGNYEIFKQIAEHQNVLIYVRPSNSETPTWLWRGGIAKPLDIKVKTINKIDADYLGYDADYIGAVGFKEPKKPNLASISDPKVREKVEARYNQRAAEYRNFFSDMNGYEQKNKFIIDKDKGVVFGYDESGKKQPVVGDHDVYDIRNLDGTRVSPGKHTQVIDHLKGLMPAVQHGAHRFWEVPDAPKYRAIDNAIRDGHRPGGEPLVVFGTGGNADLRFDDEGQSQPTLHCGGGGGGRAMPLMACTGNVAQGQGQGSAEASHGSSNSNSSFGQHLGTAGLNVYNGFADLVNTRNQLLHDYGLTHSGSFAGLGQPQSWSPSTHKPFMQILNAVQAGRDPQVKLSPGQVKGLLDGIKRAQNGENVAGSGISISAHDLTAMQNFVQREREGFVGQLKKVEDLMGLYDERISQAKTPSEQAELRKAKNDAAHMVDSALKWANADDIEKQIQYARGRLVSPGPDSTKPAARSEADPHARGKRETGSGSDENQEKPSPENVSNQQSASDKPSDLAHPNKNQNLPPTHPQAGAPQGGQDQLQSAPTGPATASTPASAATGQGPADAAASDLGAQAQATEDATTVGAATAQDRDSKAVPGTSADSLGTAKTEATGAASASTTHEASLDNGAIGDAVQNKDVAGADQQGQPLHENGPTKTADTAEPAQTSTSPTSDKTPASDAANQSVQHNGDPAMRASALQDPSSHDTIATGAADAVNPANNKAADLAKLAAWAQEQGASTAGTNGSAATTPAATDSSATTAGTTAVTDDSTTPDATAPLTDVAAPAATPTAPTPVDGANTAAATPSDAEAAPAVADTAAAPSATDASATSAATDGWSGATDWAGLFDQGGGAGESASQPVEQAPQTGEQAW